MHEGDGNLKEGQRVWHKGRPAAFLYYWSETAAVVRFDGRDESSVVSRSSLSPSPQEPEKRPRPEAL